MGHRPGHPATQRFAVSLRCAQRVPAEAGVPSRPRALSAPNLEPRKTDVALSTREVPMIWAALFLAVPTLTAILVRFFGS